MFGETLLESSPTARKHKRWPMATAFTVETIIAAVVVIVPLLSTGVIPLSARVQFYTPHREIPLEPVRPVHPKLGPSTGASAPASRAQLVPIVDHKGSVHIGPARIDAKDDTPEPGPFNPNTGNNNSLNDLLRKGNGDGPGVKPGPPRRISVPYEAQLINRVEPVYPKLASLTGVQGEVKVHAIIARDGRVIDVTVLSGHPLLAQSALDAVRQWRYRPYYLNGEPVEVETLVTVRFKRESR